MDTITKDYKKVVRNNFIFSFSIMAIIIIMVMIISCLPSIITQGKIQGSNITIIIFLLGIYLILVIYTYFTIKNDTEQIIKQGNKELLIERILKNVKYSKYRLGRGVQVLYIKTSMVFEMVFLIIGI